MPALSSPTSWLGVSQVTECPACGGKIKIIAALAEPLAIRTYLDGVSLASRAPPIAPPRPLPQTEFDYAS